MLTPYLVSVDTENPLIVLDGLTFPVNVAQFAEFEGIEVLANQQQLESALRGGYDFIEQEIEQFIRPTGRRASYSATGLTSFDVLVPGFATKIKEIVGVNGESIPMPTVSSESSNGARILHNMDMFLPDDISQFSILFQAGFSSSSLAIGQSCLSAVQTLAKMNYESVSDTDSMNMVKALIEPYQLHRPV